MEPSLSVIFICIVNSVLSQVSSLKTKKFLIVIMCICVPMLGLEHMSAGANGGQ